MNQLNIRNIILNIKNDIESHFSDSYDFRLEIIKSEIENILTKYNHILIDYDVICDNTNNKSNDNFISVDIYIKPFESTSTIVNNITIIPDKIKTIRKLRKKKLIEIHDIR